LLSAAIEAIFGKSNMPDSIRQKISIETGKNKLANEKGITKREPDKNRW